MAKKKTEDVIETPALEMLRKQIEGKWGSGLMVDAQSILQEQEEVISLSPWLDWVLSGGVTKGSFLSVSGPPKTGKTTMLLTLAAAFQKYHQGKSGGRVHYFNIERRMKKKNICGIQGLNLHPDHFISYQSKKDKILAAEEFLEIAIDVLQSDPECMVIFDSLSALVESDILAEGLGVETRGGGAKLVTRFVNVVASTVPVMKSIVCGVNHLMADTGGGRGKVEKTSNRWLYQADIRLKLAWSEPWVIGGSKNREGRVEGGREIGKKCHWECQESYLGPPGRKCTGYLRYGLGLDKVYETLEIARMVPGLISTSGNWLEFTFLGDYMDKDKIPSKLNGMERAHQLLMANPTWVELLTSKIRDFLTKDDANSGA